MMNYYEILGIQQTSSELQIKAAYKNKLLTNHPDKSGLYSDQKTSLTADINMIQEAYKVLVNSETRAEYDENLGTQVKLQGSNLMGDGLDIYNLSDFENEGDLFFRNCPRCGGIKSIELTEEDLINGAQHGEEFEVIVQCRDCSLWISVEYEEDTT